MQSHPVPRRRSELKVIKELTATSVRHTQARGALRALLIHKGPVVGPPGRVVERCLKGS